MAAMKKYVFFSPSLKLKRASHRLRAELIAKNLRELGHDAVAKRDLDGVDSNTVVVFLKPSYPADIQRARDLGAYTIYDICDNKFEEKEEYIPCCLAADSVTVNSNNMALSVLENTGRHAVVIPDPYERPRLPAKFEPGADINILWFGSSASLKFVDWVTLWQRLEKEIVNYKFTLVTAKTDRLMKKMEIRQARGQFSGVNFSRLNAVEWDWDVQGKYLENCDLVLIPIENTSHRTDTKSANRLIDSIISGRFVVTSPLASYDEFKQYSWQRHDYIAGIKWAIENPSLVLPRIVEGQDYVEQHYNPRIIAQKWLEVFNKLSGT